MDRNRGSILNLLQWQNIPRLGSAGCNRRPTSGNPHLMCANLKTSCTYANLLYLLVQRDFIRENIRRVRLPRAKPISATSTSRISDLANMGTGVIERYLSDINREHDHVTKMEFRSVSISGRQMLVTELSDSLLTLFWIFYLSSYYVLQIVLI